MDFLIISRRQEINIYQVVIQLCASLRFRRHAIPDTIITLIQVRIRFMLRPFLYSQVTKGDTKPNAILLAAVDLCC